MIRYRYIGSTLRGIWWLIFGGYGLVWLWGLPAKLDGLNKSASFWDTVRTFILTNEQVPVAVYVVLGIGMVVLQIAPRLPIWISFMWHNSARYAALMEEHDHLVNVRRDYWGMCKQLFKYWKLKQPKNHAIQFSSLEQFSDGAHFPYVHIGQNSIAEWVKTIHSAQGSPTNLLYEFCEWSLRNLKLNETKNTKFGDLQARLSNYWMKVGSSIFVEHEISYRPVYERHFPHQSRLIKLLAYFECAVDQELKSKKLRKPPLFQIYKDAKMRNPENVYGE